MKRCTDCKAEITKDLASYTESYGKSYLRNQCRLCLRIRKNKRDNHKRSVPTTNEQLSNFWLQRNIVKRILDYWRGYNDCANGVPHFDQGEHYNDGYSEKEMELKRMEK